MEFKWYPIEDRPAFMEQPFRQFIWIEGERTHNGTGPWARNGWGLAYISHDLYGYKTEDLHRILDELDMDHFNFKITHWAPASIPRP